jgi:hypothetical protein
VFGVESEFLFVLLRPAKPIGCGLSPKANNKASEDRREAMSRSRSHSFTVTFRVVVVLPDVVDTPGPALSEQNLADPDKR